MTIAPFTRLTGAAAPLLRPNIDTDVIIRIEHLTQCPKEQLGRYAFEALKYLENGILDPEFVLNQDIFLDAPVLLAGPNFGCGSSREHAVWALQGGGVRCIIAPSFGDIFYANCFENGMLPIKLPMDIIDSLAQQCANGDFLTIDLDHCLIISPAREQIEFAVDTMRRDMLLQGLDNIALSLKYTQQIRAWQERDQQQRSWAWQPIEP